LQLSHLPRALLWHFLQPRTSKLKQAKGQPKQAKGQTKQAKGQAHQQQAKGQTKQAKGQTILQQAKQPKDKPSCRSQFKQMQTRTSPNTNRTMPKTFIRPE
jgi:hypothetical protein